MSNLTLGRGRVLLGPAGATSPGAYRYVGHTTEFNINFEETTLDHYNMDEGLKEKDEQVTLEVNRSGSLITDRVSAENLALFFLGSASAVTNSLAAGEEETIDGDLVAAGQYIQLGVDDTNPMGVRGVANVVVTNVGGATTYVAGTDYQVFPGAGMIAILEGGSIVAGADLEVEYDIIASTRDRVISGRTTFEGALQFLTRNALGEDRVYYMPKVKLRANGDFALKSDEWQNLPFSIEVLKPAGLLEAIYVDGTPIAA
jgi:hypothetical protein